MRIKKKIARAEEVLATVRAERAADMQGLRESGQSVDAIGVLYGLSRERVRQILAWWARKQTTWRVR